MYSELDLNQIKTQRITHKDKLCGIQIRRCENELVDIDTKKHRKCGTVIKRWQDRCYSCKNHHFRHLYPHKYINNLILDITL